MAADVTPSYFFKFKPKYFRLDEEEITVGRSKFNQKKIGITTNEKELERAGLYLLGKSIEPKTRKTRKLEEAVSVLTICTLGFALPLLASINISNYVSKKVEENKNYIQVKKIQKNSKAIGNFSGIYFGILGSIGMGKYCTYHNCDYSRVKRRLKKLK